MPKFRKKPVVIDAVQWLGEPTLELTQLWGTYGSATYLGRDRTLLVHTLEGTMTAQVGDWIIRGVKGECYPCKPDIFDVTYDVE